jgi:hypothetical protein
VFVAGDPHQAWALSGGRWEWEGYMTKRANVTVTLFRDDHKLLQYFCKELGYKSYGLLGLALREWARKQGYDPDKIVQGFRARGYHLGQKRRRKVDEPYTTQVQDITPPRVNPIKRLRSPKSLTISPSIFLKITDRFARDQASQKRPETAAEGG